MCSICRTTGTRLFFDPTLKRSSRCTSTKYATISSRSPLTTPSDYGNYQSITSLSDSPCSLSSPGTWRSTNKYMSSLTLLKTHALRSHAATVRCYSRRGTAQVCLECSTSRRRTQSSRGDSTRRPSNTSNIPPMTSTSLSLMVTTSTPSTTS